MTIRKLITELGFELKEGDLERGEQRIANFKRNLGRVALGVGAAIVGIGTAAIAAASDMEMLTTQFEVMLGSAEKADEMMRELNQFAASTPFALEDLSRGTQQLLSFGVAEEDVIDRMRMLGDTAGGDVEKLNGLILAFGKVQTKGKASLEEINMMAERGIPIFDTLSQQLGVTKEDLFGLISAGQVSADDITQAFRTMTSEGGMFFEGMEKQSLTFAGMVSTMKDNLKLLLAEVGGTLLPVAKDVVSTVTSLFQGSLGQVIASIGSKLGPLLTLLADLIEKVFASIEPLMPIVEALIDGLINAVKPLIPIITIAIDIFTELVTALAGAGTDLNIFQEIFEAIGEVLTALRPAISIIIQLIATLFGLFSDIFSEVWVGLMDAIVPLLVEMAMLIAEILDLLYPVLELVLKLIAAIVGFAAKTLGKLIEGVAKLFEILFRGLRRGIEETRNFLGPVIDSLKGNFLSFGRAARGELYETLTPVQKLVNLFIRWGTLIPRLVTRMLQFKRNISDLKDFLERFLEGVTNTFTKIVDWIKLLFSSPGEAIRQMWSGVTAFIQESLKWVYDKINGAIDALQRVGLGKNLRRIGPEEMNEEPPTGEGGGGYSAGAYDPYESGTSGDYIDNSSGDTGGNNTEINMAPEINIEIPGAAIGPDGNVDQDLIRRTTEEAARAAFTLELKKLIIATEY